MYKADKILRYIEVIIGGLLILAGFHLININERLATALASVGIGFICGNILAIIRSLPTIKEDSEDE